MQLAASARDAVLRRGVGGFSAADPAGGRPAAGTFSKLLSRIGLGAEPSDTQVLL